MKRNKPRPRKTTVSIIDIEHKRDQSDEWNKIHLTIDVSLIEYEKKHMSDVELIFLGDRPEASEGALAIVEYLCNFLHIMENRKRGTP